MKTGAYREICLKYWGFFVHSLLPVYKVVYLYMYKKMYKRHFILKEHLRFHTTYMYVYCV